MKPKRKPLPNVKTCTECSSQFKPSSRHLKCPRCRQLNKSRSNTCRNCGTLIQNSSFFCIQCNNSLNTKTKPYSEKKKKITSNGYVRFSNGVFEHRYIVEQKIGRKLLKGENVHHKNGVKTDNRPENLELWIVNQPSGQKPSDLVKWAKEIISRYDNNSFKNL